MVAAVIGRLSLLVVSAVAAGLVSGCGGNGTVTAGGDESGLALARRVAAVYDRLPALDLRYTSDLEGGGRVRIRLLYIAPSGRVEKVVLVNRYLRDTPLPNGRVIPKGSLLYIVTDNVAGRIYSRLETQDCWRSMPGPRVTSGHLFPLGDNYDAPRRSGRFLILREHRSGDGSVSDYRIDARTLRVVNEKEVEPGEVEPGESAARIGIARWRGYEQAPPTPVTRPVCR